MQDAARGGRFARWYSVCSTVRRCCRHPSRRLRYGTERPNEAQMLTKAVPAAPLSPRLIREKRCAHQRRGTRRAAFLGEAVLRVCRRQATKPNRTPVPAVSGAHETLLES